MVTIPWEAINKAAVLGGGIYGGLGAALKDFPNPDKNFTWHLKDLIANIRKGGVFQDKDPLTRWLSGFLDSKPVAMGISLAIPSFIMKQVKLGVGPVKVSNIGRIGLNVAKTMILAAMVGALADPNNTTQTASGSNPVPSWQRMPTENALTTGYGSGGY